MIINKILLTLIVLIGIMSCQKIEKVKKRQEIINLHKSKVSDQILSDFRNVLFPAVHLNSEYKEHEQNRLQKFKNIPQLDSFRIVSQILDKDLYYLDLLKNNLISKEELLDNTKNISIDSSIIYRDFSNYRFNAVFGFEGNKRIIIADLNNNLDFEDDPIMTFSTDSSYSFQNPKSIEKIKPQNFRYQGLVNNKLKWIERSIKVYPNENSIYKYSVKELIKNPVDAKYTAMILFEDIYTTKQKIEETTYNIAIYGVRLNKYATILIKPDSIVHNFYNQNNFEYSLTDTIKADSTYFKIDSIGSDFDKLYISKLQTQIEKKYGGRIGDNIKNYKLKDLHGQNLNWYSNQKKYRLLDFWGTWCTPCKELTPDLKDLYKENSDELEIISIAADENIEHVQNYVSSNNLNWQHAYIYLKDYSLPIRRELKVYSFPTFVLLDKNNKILIKGAGSDAFKEIEKFIEKN